MSRRTDSARMASDWHWPSRWKRARPRETDGITMVQLPDLRARTIVSGAGNYRNLTFDESGERFAFLTDRDTYKEKKPTYAVYFVKPKSSKPAAIVTAKSEGMPSGWQIPESSSLRFSKNGKSLYFSTAPVREEEKEKKEAEDDEDKPVKVDIWHWQDPWLQPMQLLRAEMEKRRTYPAVVHLEQGRMLQLATPDMPSVMTGDEGNARFALGTSDLPYRKLISWDYPGFQDAYLIDTLSGKADRVLEKSTSRPSWSPKARVPHLVGFQRTGLVRYVSFRAQTHQALPENPLRSS